MFFTAGYTYYSSLPPIVNDFVMYVNRVRTADGSRSEDMTFPEFDNAESLQLVGDLLYLIGTNQQKYRSLISFHVDNKSIVRIVDEDCSNYIVSNGWVYYTVGWSAGDDGFYSLRRVRIDGTGDMLISDETQFFNFNVAGDWIFYYENVEDEGEIVFRIRTDGTGSRIRVGRYH